MYYLINPITGKTHSRSLNRDTLVATQARVFKASSFLLELTDKEPSAPKKDMLYTLVLTYSSVE